MRPSAATCSAALHGAAVIGVLCFYRADLARPRPSHPQPRAIAIWNLPVREAIAAGGGQRETLPASLGNPPPRATALRVFVPPTAHLLNANPKLVVEQALLMDPDIPLPEIRIDRIGSPFGVDGPLSGGHGGPGGIGEGGCCGIGNQSGPGIAARPAAPRPHTSGPPPQPPVLLYKVEPEYSEEARKAKVQGIVVLTAEVDTGGRLRNLRVTQPLGLGLDERAVEAARRWRFRPASSGGHPVPHPVTIEVNFRLL